MTILKSSIKFIEKRKRDNEGRSATNRKGLLAQINRQQGHKGNVSDKFPFVKFINYHNEECNNNQGWLSKLLNDVIGRTNNEKKNIFIALTHSLMIGSKEPNAALAKALDQDHLDGFVIPLLRSCLIPDEQTEKLLEAVESSLKLNATTKVSPLPLSEYLEQKQKDTSNKGWLLRLIIGRKSDSVTTIAASQSESVVKSVLHNVLKGHCKLKGTLLFACGTKGPKEINRLKVKSMDLFRSCLKENILSGDASVADTRTTFPMTQTVTSSFPSMTTGETFALQIDPTGLLVGNTGNNEVLSPITTKNSERACNTSFNTLFPSPTPKRICSKHTPFAFSKNQFSTPSNASIRQRQQDGFSFIEEEENELRKELFSSAQKGKDNEITTLSTDLARADFFGSLGEGENENTNDDDENDSTVCRSSDCFSSLGELGNENENVTIHTAEGEEDNDKHYFTLDRFSQDGQEFIRSLQHVTSDADLESKVIEFAIQQSNSDGIISNKYRMLAQIPKPKKLNPSTKYRKEYIKNKSKDLHRIIPYLLGKSGIELGLDKDVVTDLIESNFGMSVWESSEDQRITAVDMIAIRDRAGPRVTTNAIESISKDFERLLQEKKMLKTKRAFVGQLRKKIGKSESESAIPATVLFIDCNVTKDKVNACIYYYIKNVPLLMERMVASCILDGKYKESFDISDFVNKIIFKFGADRGGGDLMIMIGLANRLKGNTGYFSIPIGVVEGATEDRSNLKQTIYSEARIKIIEELVNQELYMIIIHFMNEDIVYDVKCILLKLTGAAAPDGREISIECEVEKDPELFCGDTQFSSNASERENADQVHIDESFLCDNKLPLNIKFIESGEICIGCRLFSKITGEDIFSFKFDSSVILEAVASKLVYGAQLYGLPTEDGKMTACVSGISTCSSSYSCPGCLWLKSERTVRKWMLNYGFPEAKCKDYPRRVGQFSRENCNKRFKLMNNTTALEPSLDLKKRVFSVVQEPLLKIRDHFLYVHTGDPLHLGSGILTHLHVAICSFLAKHDEVLGKATFKEKLKNECIAFVEEMIALEKSKEFAKARSLYNRVQKAVNDAVETLQQAKSGDNGDNEELIEAVHLRLNERVSERDKLDEQHKYSIMLKKVHAGKEMKALLAELKRSKKKDLNKAEFLFMRAIKTYAGDFNKNHGQLELTNARGIKALESREKIAKIVTDAYNDDPYINEVMEFYLNCADPLFEMLVIMKDQKKQTEASINRFEQLLTNYTKLWMSKIEGNMDKNPIFYKLHVLMCCFVRFLRKSKMSGLSSSEGFEHKHYVMAQLKVMMAAIADDNARCQKLTQRQQVSLLAGCNDVHRFLEEKDKEAKTGPRGPYQSRGLRKKINQNISVSNKEREVNEGHFTTALGYLMPIKLDEYYRFMLRDKVPEDWRKTFTESEDIGNMATHSSSFL